MLDTLHPLWYAQPTMPINPLATTNLVRQLKDVTEDRSLPTRRNGRYHNIMMLKALGLVTVFVQDPISSPNKWIVELTPAGEFILAAAEQ